MCGDIYLLAIAVVSLCLVAMFFFTYMPSALFVSETKCLSYVCTNVGSIGALYSSSSGV